MAFDPVKMKRVLNSFGDSVVADAKKNLQSSGNNNRPITVMGNLEEKISFAARVMPNSMSLKFDLGQYGEGIDQGIKGSSPMYNQVSGTPFKFQATMPSKAMRENLDRWARRVGFTFLEDDRKWGLMGLGAGILAYGIKPTKFFRKAYEKHFKNLDRELVEAFGLDVDDFFEFIFKE